MGPWSLAAQRAEVDLLTLVERVETASPDTLGETLAGLAQALTLHTSREEVAGGLLFEAKVRRPEQIDAIDALMAEHAALVSTLRAAEGDIEAARAACAAIRDHERREADLLAELVYFETGGSE